MKKNVLLTITSIISLMILLSISCKKTDESSETSGWWGSSGCDCNDINCWYDATDHRLPKLACMISTAGLSATSSSKFDSNAINTLMNDRVKIHNSCTMSLDSKFINVLQTTSCSIKDVKILSETYNELKTMDSKLTEKIKQEALITNPSYTCPGQTSCNLGAMHLFGVHSKESKTWTAGSLANYCYGKCLDTALRGRSCSQLVRSKLNKPENCEAACQANQCPEATVTCLAQCCNQDYKCIIDSKNQKKE